MRPEARRAIIYSALAAAFGVTTATLAAEASKPKVDSKEVQPPSGESSQSSTGASACGGDGGCRSKK